MKKDYEIEFHVNSLPAIWRGKILVLQVFDAGEAYYRVKSSLESIGATTISIKPAIPDISER